MLGLSTLAEVPLASVSSITGTAPGVDGMPAAGFSLAKRSRAYEVGERGREFYIAERYRVFQGFEMAGCCIDGGSVCLAAGETEWLYFDFAARLGDRIISSITSVVVAPVETSPDGLTASSQEIISDDYIVDDETTLEADTAVKLKLAAGTGAGGTTFEVVVTVVLSDTAVIKQRGWITVE